MDIEIERIAASVVTSSITIHRELGPGLLESVYREILAHELKKRGHQVEQEKPIPVVWDGHTIPLGFRVDLYVDDLLLVELKAVERVDPVHYRQLLTYLRVTNRRLGLLINFGEELVKNGIRRVAN